MKITWRAEFLPLLVASMAILIVISGGYVRINDSGESCPDWPTCFGKIHPFTSADEQGDWWEQNTDEIDSRGADKRYSVFEIFIEWFHRLIVGITGFVVLANLYFVNKSKDLLGKDVQYSSYIVALLLLSQALIGAITVRYDNADWSVSLHLFLAMIFISSLLLHWLLWSRATKTLFEKLRPPLDYALRNIRILGGMSFSVLLLLLIGAWLSSAEGGSYNAGCNIGWYTGWPLCHGSLFPNFSSTSVLVQMIHRIAVLLVAAVLIYGYFRMKEDCGDDSSVKTIRKFTIYGYYLFLANILIGGAYIITATSDGFTELLSLLHLLLGSATFLCITFSLLVCMTEIRYSRESSRT